MEISRDTLNRPTYPIREAFRLLCVSPPVGYRLVHAGTLRSYKLGSRRFATAESIRECLRALEGLEPKPVA